MPQTSALQSATYTTDDPESAHEWMRSVYTDYAPRRSRSNGLFRFSTSQRSLDALTISAVDFPEAGSALTEPVEALIAVSVRSGRYGFREGRRDVRAARNQTVLIPQHRAVEVLWNRLDVDVVMLAAADVQQAADGEIEAGSGPVLFDGGLPNSPADDRRWQSAVDYVNRAVFANPWARESPLIQAEATRVLTSALVAGFRHQRRTTRSTIPPGPVSAAVLRKATSFVIDNAQSPITVDAIAGAAGVDIATISRAFRDQLHTTPLNYLRRVRLAGAHAELRQSDGRSTDTIPMIAARWGFPLTPAFSARYLAEFGESPQDTMSSQRAPRTRTNRTV